MEMQPVDSSLIDSTGYDAASRTANVKFKSNGSTYAYPNLPPDKYEAWMASESVGKHFLREIRPHYPGHKVG